MGPAAVSQSLTGREIDAAVLRLVSSPTLSIPPAPTVALKLQSLMGKDDFGGPELVKIVQTDGALTAMVLRYANSAARAGVVEITELPAAVSRVGIRTIARIALAQELGQIYGQTGRLDMVRNRLWQRSLISGLVCHTLATHRGWNSEEAFAAGLLHDFGATVVLAAAETVIAESEVQRPAQVWYEMSMQSHLDVGRLVSFEWNLPSLLHDAMVYHHSPGMSEFHRELLELIEVSDRVCTLFERKVEVTAEDLLVCLGDEREVERILHELPGYAKRIELLSQPPDPNRPARTRKRDLSAVRQSAKSVLRQPIIDLDLDVDVIGHSGDYQAVGVASDGLVLNGGDPLPLNALTRVQILCDRDSPFELWCNAVLCEPVEHGYRIELRPFALCGVVKQRFIDLFVRAKKPGSRSSA